ncbi:MAG: cell division protein FtsX [Acidimicrobiales bacterium]
MAIRVDYIAKETGNNLIRNPSLTLATVLTVAVSLALLGSALLISKGIDGLNTQFRDNVEFIVWIEPDATPEQVAFVERALDGSEGVKSSRYVDRDETFSEFQEFWEGNPTVIETVTPEQLPTRFDVVPVVPDLPVVEGLGAEFAGLPGVRDVKFASEYIKQLNTLTNFASNAILVAAVVSALASGMLMYNTIRTALFARRREVEVMRLVGASNWFIRVPFMLEGLVQGVAGAGIAGLVVFGLNRLLRNQIVGVDFRLLESFVLAPGEVAPIAMWLLLAGAAIGFVGSGVAVTRYLDA